MATLKEEDLTCVGGSEPAQEDSVEEQLSDFLLDLSEELSLREQEPHEYHCYTGPEEAVCGWARVAPLSCILLSQKPSRPARNKEAVDTKPTSAEPKLSSASIAESHAGPRCNLKKPMPLNQRVGPWSNTAVAALQPEATEWPVLNAMWKTTAKLLLEERIEEEGTSRGTSSQRHHLSLAHSASDKRPTKPRKNNHGPHNTLVPIQNFTFLPLIKSPHFNPKVGGQLCGGKKTPDGESSEEKCFMFDRTREERGTGVDLPGPCAALTCKQHNPMFFSALRVSIHKRHPAPVSTKPDTVRHRNNFEVKSLTQDLHVSTAVGAHARMLPGCMFS